MHEDSMSYIRVGACPEASFYDPERLGEAETYEDIAVLLVDIDGTTAFVAIASNPEVGEGLYEEASQALLSTTFTE